MKLTVEGIYWDSQIYSGELLLFDADGAIHRIDWRGVVDSIADKNPSVQTAIRVAFSDSDLFYNQKVRKILCDPQIELPIKSQLAQLAGLSLHAARRDWDQNWRIEETPFDFLPTDTEVYYNNIFAAGNAGLFSTPRSATSAGRMFAKKTQKHHDAKILQVKASDHFTAVAAAAGEDGLFEFAFKRSESNVLDSERRLATRPCSSCDWAFQSVMGWTVQNAFLASFRQEKDPTSKRLSRIFDRIVDTREIFQDSLAGEYLGQSYVWGCREKMYRITMNGLEVTHYSHQPTKKSKSVPQYRSHQFSQHGTLPITLDSSTIVATGTAPFGTVLELDDRLIIIRSDGLLEEIIGEPVHWRIFPRSEHYSNQIHIIYDDRMEIISFVHDYFVDQTSKLAGFRRGSNDFVGED
ncbi:hypothetical protein [Herbaspirillum seropedicae]|uniref:hypothetical protein n=1 Tax=Herbaspirillum seropedicae TaxID=964 RepID=UPI003FCCFD39